MNIVLLLFLICVIVSVREPLRYDPDYLSIERTHIVNGIFIVFVFLRHFWQYVGEVHAMDTLFDIVNYFLGQCIVTTFMFYSGYGVTASIWKKRASYLKSFPVNRILKTTLLFDIAILLYLVLAFFTKEELSVPKVLLAFIGLKSIGNSSWYIFAILCMYLISWVSFRPFIGQHDAKGLYTSLTVATLLTLVYMLIVRRFEPGQYYNTVLCYIMGMWWYAHKEKIDGLLKKNGFRTVSTLMAIALFILSHYFRDTSIIADQLQYIFFVIGIVLLTASFKLKSRVFKWMGENLLGLYILQRLPMIIFQRVDFIQRNTYVYYAMCLIVTGILAYLYHILVIKNVNKAFEMKKE